MAEAVEVAIELALLERATAFAGAQSLPLSVPNRTYDPTDGSNWLRASFMPAPSFSMGIPFSAPNQHYGLLQIDVFVPLDKGDAGARRIGALAVAYFKRGTVMSKEGFDVTIFDTPRMAASLEYGKWWQVPVTIPYKNFAPPPS